VAWGVLIDSTEKGCYERGPTIPVTESRQQALLYESALFASPNQKAALSQLNGSPGLFPFQIPPISGDSLGAATNRLVVMRYGLDEEIVSLST